MPDFELPLVVGGERCAGAARSTPGGECGSIERSVRELRVKGLKLLDSKVTVRGVVTWAYDCATAIRAPGQTDADLKRRINADPTLCERPKFYLGDSAQTPVEKSLWIVDVPRPYNKMELERIAKAERTMPDRCEPGAKASVCPPYQIGDVVILTGDFRVSSPHNERNSDGLLVFGAMRNVTHDWSTPGTTWTDKAPTVVPVAGGGRVAPAVLQARPPVRPMRKVVDKQAHDASMAKLGAANRAYGTKQLDEAIAAYREAVTLWPGNHVGWYGIGGAYALRGEWEPAAESFARAARLRDDVAMYRMWLGVAMYELIVQRARADQAKQQNLKPEEIRPDLSAINFEKPMIELGAAVQLDPGLWRAHYYLGRIHRASGHALPAADEFTAALRSQPRDPSPYVALGELYRRWDYTEQAVEIARLGTQHVVGSDAAELWFLLGMAYDDKRRDQDAIDAFTKALDLRRDLYKAQFQRGQTYFRIGDSAHAKRDLEEFSKVGGGALAVDKQVATAMLMDLARKASGR